MALFDQTVVNLFLTQFLPFIIIFAVLYGLLQKSGIFGKGGRSVKMLNVLISIAISVMVVFVNPLQINWGIAFGNLFSGTTVIAIFLAFVVIFALMFGAASGRSHSSVIVLIVAVVLGFIGLSISGIVPQLLPNLGQNPLGSIDLSQYSVYIVLGIFFGIIVLLLRVFTRPEQQPAEQRRHA